MRFTCLRLNPSSSAACRRVIRPFFVFRNVTSRSLSACVISSCPSCIPQAWGCQGDISTLPKGDIITLPPQQMESTQTPEYHHWNFSAPPAYPCWKTFLYGKFPAVVHPFCPVLAAGDT